MRFSVGQKLAAVVLLLFGLHLVAFFVSQAQLRDYRANTLRLTNESLPQVQALDQLELDSARIAEHATLYAATDRAVALMEISTELERHITSARQQLQRLRATAPRFNQAVEGRQSGLDIIEGSLEGLISQARRVMLQRNRVEQPNLIRELETLQRLNASLEQNIDPLRQIIADDQQAVVAAAQSNPLIIPAVLTVAITFFVGLLLWGVYYVVVRPIRRLTAATAAMAAGEARREININSGDEIGILARSFNSMTEAVEAQQQQLRERAETLEAANAAQQQLLETVRVLSVPTIPLNDGVLLLPLMGAINHERAQHLSKTLLTAVEQQRAHTVILDCTGLTTPDAETIRYFTDTTRALRLLGAQTICTGIQPAFAMALSQAELRLEAAAIYATVGEGIAATRSFDLRM